MYDSIGEWVAKRRRELGHTQTALAARTRYGVDTIRKVEQGRYRPSSDLVTALANHLNIHGDDLLAFQALADQPLATGARTTTSATVDTDDGTVDTLVVDATPDSDYLGIKLEQTSVDSTAVVGTVSLLGTTSEPHHGAIIGPDVVMETATGTEGLHGTANGDRPLRRRFAFVAALVVLVCFMVLVPQIRASVTPMLRMVGLAADNPTFTTVTVKSTDTFTSMAPTVEVHSGDRVKVTYVSGTWTININNVASTDPFVGAEGYSRQFGYMPLPNANAGSLIAQVGSGPFFPVGKGIMFTADQDGQLKFQINDAACSDCSQPFEDNKGAVTLHVEIVGANQSAP